MKKKSEYNRGDNTKTEQEALSILSGLCARGEHCSGDMLEKMRRWQMDEEAMARVMAYLTDKGFIDDGRYCRLYAIDKLKFNKWGRHKIAFSLRSKGVGNNAIEEALAEIDNQQFIDALTELLDAKSRTLDDDDPYMRRQKLIKFALGRGFDMDIILKVLKE